MKTYGQAIDEAIERHGKFYPESDVYEASVVDAAPDVPGAYMVRLRASHFSVELTYYVDDRHTTSGCPDCGQGPTGHRARIERYGRCFFGG